MRMYPNLNMNSFIVAQSHLYNHALNFEKYSNCGFNNVLSFKNGGIGVNLLQLDMSKLNQTTETLEAYSDIS